MKLFSSILLLIVAISPQVNAIPSTKQSQLFLIGGGLKSCSTMANKNCNNKALTQFKLFKNVKQHALYKIDQKSINLVKDTWPKYFNIERKKQIIALLMLSIEPKSQAKITLETLKSQLRLNDTKDIINKLTDPEYYLLLDLLEQPVVNADTGERLKEQVDLTNSTNVFSTKIYQKFVEQAKKNSKKTRPKIVIITASSRDPFEAVDFYESTFEQAGADAIWLPLDATLNELIQAQGNRQKVCKNLTKTRLKTQGSSNREFVYPDLVEKQLKACLQPSTIINEIKNADGLFINGGDQSLTLKAFLNNDGSDNDILTLIKQKLRHNYFIVGGTSAGTAVMSGGIYENRNIPMITNGTSAAAIIRGAKQDKLPIEGCQKSNQCDELRNDDLTYRTLGGLGLFHWGVTDTHFSERGRQGRLAKLLLDTTTRFAFGVDEATALIVTHLNNESPYFEVLGQGGVFIIENNKAKSSVVSHYINVGDTGNIVDNNLNISIAAWKNVPPEDAPSTQIIDHIFDGMRYQKMAEILCRSNAQMFEASDAWEQQNIKVNVSKLKTAFSGYGFVEFDQLKKGYCSYKNYRFTLDVDE